MVLSSSDISQVSLTVTWTGGDVATSYSFFLTNHTTPSEPINTHGGIQPNGKSVKYFGLHPSTDYEVVVVARNDGGNVSASIRVSTLDPGPGVDATPTNLDATSVTPTGLTLIWSGGNTATSYAYFFNGVQTTPSVDNGVSGQNAIFTGLTPSTNYTIYIVATAPSAPSVNPSYPSSSFNVSTADLPTQTITIECTDNDGNPVVGPVYLSNYPGSQFVYTFTQTGATSPSIRMDLFDISGSPMTLSGTDSSGLQELIQYIGGSSTLSSVPDVVTANPFVGAIERPGFYCNSLQTPLAGTTTLLIDLDYTTSVGSYYRTYDPTQFYTKVVVTVTDTSSTSEGATFILELYVQDMS
jgi:hypothetical protein